MLFLQTFPTYAIKTNSGRGFHCLERDNGILAIVVFTDDDLLNRYLENEGFEKHDVARFDTPREFAQVLRGSPRIGDAHTY